MVRLASSDHQNVVVVVFFLIKLNLIAPFVSDVLCSNEQYFAGWLASLLHDGGSVSQDSCCTSSLCKVVHTSGEESTQLLK